MSASEQFGQQRHNILIVDDEAPVLHSLRRVLRDDRYHIIEASDGTEALEKLNETEFSLIISDQFLPDYEGIEVLLEAQKLQPQATRIIMTGSHDLKVVVEAINVGQVAQFIQKPWDAEALKNVVRTAIERYELTKENQELHARIVDQHRQLQLNHTQLQKELELGARIHRVMLRGQVPDFVNGVQIEAVTEPSKQIDGDFFDFYDSADATFDVVMGDVMGKGIPAALVGTALKTQLRRFAVGAGESGCFTEGSAWRSDIARPKDVLMSVQDEVGQQLIDLEYFVTLFYGRFQLDQWRFVYVDCGSTKPIHYSKEHGTTRLLKGDNYPIGTIPDDIFEEHEVYYGEGDLFVFYSDGVTEACSPDGELYGEERLQDFVRNNAQLPPRALQHLLYKSVIGHTGSEELHDDLTIIVLQTEKLAETLSSQVLSAKFYADLTQLDALRAFIDDLCSAAPGDNQRLSQQMQLAVNEAFCNAVKHGTGESIVLKGELQAGGVMVELSDQGEPFDPAKAASLDLGGERDGGYGMYMMKEILDRISYSPRRTRDGWNHLQMYKSYFVEEAQMEFKHAKQNDVLVVALEGNHLDAREAPGFKEQVTNLIQTESADNVVFDLSKLEFIDSSGLGSFLSILRHLNNRGGDLKLASMPDPIRTMFEIVRMHKLFEIFNSSDDAVRSFKA